MTHRKLKNYMVSIAKLYGARVIFEEGMTGTAELDGRIRVGTGGSKAYFISTFCHELGHHVNQIDGKYPIYHAGPNSRAWSKVEKMSLEWRIAYAYRAEAYTDKVAKKLCATWFPGVKFSGYYNGDAQSKAFMYGYYMNGFDSRVGLTPPPGR